MKIAFLTDSLDTFKIYKDSTFAMMREAFQRNHFIYVFKQDSIILEDGLVTADACKVELTSDINNWYHMEKAILTFLPEFDIIIIRKDPPFNMEYIYTTYLLELAEKQGARIINRPDALRNYNEKLAITQFPEFIVPTIVTRNKDSLQAFHTKYQNIILKPLDGMGGMGIFFIRQDGMNLRSIIEILTNNGKKTIMAQRFIPEISAGDKRILLIGGKVVPYVLARIPQGNEIRGNLAVGGVGIAQEISVRERIIAEKLAPILTKNGLFLVGLDIIGDYLTEINITSPTCFQEITQQTGFNVAALFIDILENIVVTS